MIKIEEMAKELFGEMRNLTQEEQEHINDYLNSISKPTGIKLFDFLAEDDNND